MFFSRVASPFSCSDLSLPNGRVSAQITDPVLSRLAGILTAKCEPAGRLLAAISPKEGRFTQGFCFRFAACVVFGGGFASWFGHGFNVLDGKKQSSVATL